MDIRQMRQLAAIHLHGSLAKAAQALGVSQPSLSTAMARLEDQLKVKLFDRSAKGSRLTPIGELIVERASKVISETEEMLRDASLVAGGEAGEIRIGVSTILRDVFLSRLIRDLAAAYPALGISVLVSDRDRFVPLLKQRELDVAICAYGDDLATSEFVATGILTVKACAAAAPDHPLASETSISIERFGQFPSAGSIHTHFTNATLLAVGDEPASLLHYRSNDYAPLIELALGGYTTLIAPRFVLEPYLRDGRLQLLSLDWSFKVSFAAITTRPAAYSPIVSRVIQHAVSLGAELQDAADE